MRATFAALVVTWYAASVVAVLSAKLVLERSGAPASLCALQLTAATLLCRLQHGSKRMPAVGEAEQNLVRAIAVSYALGFLLTNAGIAVAAPSFIETFKAAEPLSTVILAAIFLGEQEKPLTLVSLSPIVCGVAMASFGSAAFSIVGMALAIMSNGAFSARAVLTKRLKATQPESACATSDIVLFYHVSRIGLLVLVPCALIFDASALHAALFDAPSAAPRGLPLLLLANSCAHALYNGVSFAVLARVSTASHAVINICRRVVVVAAAAALFKTPVSALNWCGVGLAVIGVTAFARSKQGDAAFMWGGGRRGGRDFFEDDATRARRAATRPLLPA